MSAPRHRDDTDPPEADFEDLSEGVLHDLAGSLTAIGGWAELALSNPDQVPPQRALELIRESAATASRLARQILPPSGAVRAEPVTTDPLEVAQQVARLLRPLATRRGASIRVETFPGARPELEEAPCFSVFWNLLHNAISWTDEGTEVMVRLGGTARAVGVRIIDHGPGMDEATKRRALERRFSRRPGGRGLGLPRVAALVDRMGGELRLTDAPGRGLQVDVVLPAPTGERARALKESGVMARRPEAVMAGARILVVDDDDALRLMLVTSLELRGARCSQAASLAQARGLGDAYDVALIDLNLRDGSGLELARELTHGGHTQSIVLMSGQTSLPPSAAFRPDAWLRKPFEPADALATTERMLLSVTEASVGER